MLLLISLIVHMIHRHDPPSGMDVCVEKEPYYFIIIILLQMPYRTAVYERKNENRCVHVGPMPD